MKELAQQAKLEQLSEQKKRMKMIQLRRDTEQMMIERRQKYAEEMQLLMKLEEQGKQEAEQRFVCCIFDGFFLVQMSNHVVEYIHNWCLYSV